MSTSVKNCSVCSTTFELQFAYQAQKSADGTFYFCSQRCHEQHLLSAAQKTCVACGTRFELQFAYQQSQSEGEVNYYCSTECRGGYLRKPEAPRRTVRKIAVLNQKGWDRQDDD